MSTSFTSVAPTAEKLWRRAKTPLILLTILIAGVTLLVLVSKDSGARDDLHPDSYAPGGSHALVQLLENAGVPVERASTLSEAESALRGGDSTLLIARPDLLASEQLAELRDSTRHLVLVGARGDSVSAVLPGVAPVGAVTTEGPQPDCSLAPAVAAGDTDSGGIRYESTDSALISCYEGSLVQRFGAGDATVTLLGSGAPLTNELLDARGNAALGMRLLGEQPRLVWYLPSPADLALPEGEKSFADLVPAGVKFAVVQLFIAAAVLALWRARRLGPVVSEPLPVVVRAAETVEGRARLYRRSHASSHAGGVLRQAARRRMAPAVGLSPDAEPAALITALSAHVGRPGAELHQLLYGPPPQTDVALVALVGALDRLEKEVNAR